MSTSFRTFAIALLILGASFASGTPVHAQNPADASCTPGQFSPEACVESSTCNTQTGQCERNMNVPNGGACLQDTQCASNICSDGECVAELRGPLPASSVCGREGGLVSVLPEGVCTLEDVLVIVLDLMVQVGTILLVLMLVFSGFKFVAAQGNPEEIKSARTALTWTVIGGFMLLGAEAVALIIKATVQSL